MFLFHSCNHALTPHFHQFTVLDKIEQRLEDNEILLSPLEREKNWETLIEKRDILLDKIES